MRIISIMLMVILFVSCKTKSVVGESKKTSKKVEAEEVFKNYYKNQGNFSTLYIKANAKFNNGSQVQNVSAEIKIKKDEQILISIRFLGITMAKALIKPNYVSYYEKMGETSYEGNFTGLTKLFGTDLNYSQIQNMLVGKRLDTLNDKRYQVFIDNGMYRLDNIDRETTEKSFFLDMQKFTLQKQTMVQNLPEKRSIEISYLDYKPYKEIYLPSSIIINAAQEKTKIELGLIYTTVTVNDELSFPYSIPAGFK